MQRPTPYAHAPTPHLFEAHRRREAECVDRAGGAVVAVLTLIEDIEIRALGEFQVCARAEAVAKPLLILELVEDLVVREQVRHPAKSFGSPAVFQTYARTVGVARGVDGVVHSKAHSQRIAPELPGTL